MILIYNSNNKKSTQIIPKMPNPQDSSLQQYTIFRLLITYPTIINIYIIPNIPHYGKPAKFASSAYKGSFPY
jgi:hypothetical protein